MTHEEELRVWSQYYWTFRRMGYSPDTANRLAEAGLAKERGAGKPEEVVTDHEEA